MGYRGSLSRKLLIAPSGIEIAIKIKGYDPEISLLIAPSGIEMTHPTLKPQLTHPFNRTFGY